LENDLRALSIDKFDCPTKRNGQSTVDSNVIIDLYEVALDQPSVQTFVLMAGDSDYVRVVAKLVQRMDKDIIIMGVRGSVSRDLVRAAGGREVLLEPVQNSTDEKALIRLIDRYESSRHPGTLPTFNYLSQYIANPRNAELISPQTVSATLNDLIQRELLVQEVVDIEDGRQIRITKLSRDHPLVVDALSLS
jgi:hypothetical protein